MFCLSYFGSSVRAAAMSVLCTAVYPASKGGGGLIVDILKFDSSVDPTNGEVSRVFVQRANW